MSKDFRIKQLRTSQVIVSGSSVGTKPSAMIYSASAATNVDGGHHADLLTNVGTDVWYFVSGSITGTEAILLGGDTIISGTMIGLDSLTIKKDTGGSLLLQSSDTTITSGNNLGKIQFQAPDEASGTDAILVGAEIAAEAASLLPINFSIW